MRDKKYTKHPAVAKMAPNQLDTKRTDWGMLTNGVRGRCYDCGGIGYHASDCPAYLRALGELPIMGGSEHPQARKIRRGQG